MKYNSLLFFGLVARSTASPQGGSGAVTDKIAPQGGVPDGCQTNAPGQFQVRTQRLSDPIIPAQQSQTYCDSAKSLVMTLNDGVLTDIKGRTGYVASNFQFQFDGPPQAGSIYTAGFSLCGNGSMALGPSTVFYQCLSGTFYNLYDRNWAAQCEPILMMAMPCGGDLTTASVNEIGDGQPQAPVQPPAPVISQIGDGQPQAPNQPAVPYQPVAPYQPAIPNQPAAPVVSQIGDGQLQAPVQPAVPAAPAVSEIGDGQPQAPVQPAPPAAPAAPAAPAVSQIGDGQPQAPYNPQQPPAPVVSQISDGQPQAPLDTSANAPAATSAPAGAEAPASTQPAYEVSQGVRMVLPGVATVIAMAMAGGILIL
ncbi:hypothetical protein CP533_3033 [Ophiocordyceps camponoti-saundersi (nom. inval.)]|nr:hypothetical protein CP533_3033 [Ophiocordyceps camponoti-saundersi (nom. inval.)]